MGGYMNKKIKNLSKDILSGKQLQENIPQLFNFMANYYQTYASVGLAMNYYSFYESYLDSENSWSADAVAIMKQMNAIITDSILQSCSGAAREKAIMAVDQMRRDISKRMNMLTAYTDIFLTYEYILNRLEYRYRDKIETIDEVEFSREILRYIFADQDNFVINEKIREIIGQLPIRITKQKYFDLLRESFDSYLGADLASLQSYLYLLRTSAMLYQEEEMDSYYPRLWDMKQKLAAVEYKSLSKQGYDDALSTLQGATLMLEIETSVYFSLQEMMNEIYALLLCDSYAGMVQNDHEKAVKVARDIIRETNELFLSDNNIEIPHEIETSFEALEGVQEEISFDLTMLEDALYEVGVTHEALTRSMMLDSVLQALNLSNKLLSNSLFVELEEKQEEITVDEEILDREAGAFLADINTLFEGQDKTVNRAIIANTINKMPVFFKDHKEVMDYVRYSMERCSDPYEKAACYDIINEIMSE
jgi:hypothetical protein